MGRIFSVEHGASNWTRDEIGGEGSVGDWTLKPKSSNLTSY